MPSLEQTPERVREFVIAAHGQFDRVREMLAESPGLLNVAHPWSDQDHETAIQAAAHAGNQPIAEFLLDLGAPLAICTAASLGRVQTVQQMWGADPNAKSATGAHRIPLLAHAVWSGQPAFVTWLLDQGAELGITLALLNTAARGSVEVAQVLLDTGKVDLAAKDFQGKTALVLARERSSPKLEALLQSKGANS